MQSKVRVLSTILVTLFATVWMISASVNAQVTVPIRQRAVDSVTVKDGPRLCGAIIGHDADGSVTIAVRREWLKKKAAKYYAAEFKNEQVRANTDLTKLLERIEVWRKESAGEKDLLPFLDREKKRIEAVIDTRKNAPEKALSEFMLLRIPKRQLRSGYRQPARQRLIALYAWRERIDEPETRKAADLLSELKRKKIDLSSASVDLSDRLPPVSENEFAWAARKAIVEYDALKRVRFQGTNGYLVQAGGDTAKQPDISRIFREMLNGQVNKLLGEALGNPQAAMKQQADAAFQKAVKIAETKKVRGFRITRVDPDLLTKRVTVEEQFIAKLPDGKWRPVWKFKSTVDATKDRPNAKKRIEEDEQVKQALKAAKALGLVAGKETIETAFRFGAATMEAQQEADAEFHLFRERYIKRLDTPPFRMGK